MGQRRKEPLSLAGNDMVPERAAHAPTLRLVIYHGRERDLDRQIMGRGRDEQDGADPMAHNCIDFP